MTLQEFMNLRLNDPVLDSKKRISRAYDIDRSKRLVKTSRLGGCWRYYKDVNIPAPEPSSGKNIK